ncbi:amino acid adenylation domain-containing protein [Kutzneria viridogrisea]|uniref:Amino acid adenylation domain-containing protein n=1 Tax=Kutzneria viridogrisea TaxID=47990 RepID=A0ABR6B7T1_9PSEU|nr:amino acid adenylation domain-containing protein [Kutzneria viridogrisea]
MATGHEFWQGVLAAGGYTAVPRWVLGDPAVGVAQHEEKLSEQLLTALRERTSLSTALLSAHVKVVAALSGEREVVTGYRPEQGRQALPFRVSTEVRGWGELLAQVHGVEQDVVRHKDFPIAASGPLFETELDLAGGEPAGHTVFAVGLREDVLVLRYRTEALDAAAAERVAGYHVSALAALVAGDWEGSLLSERELDFQLNGLAGPRRELPDARFHELFEQRVREHPDTVAAVHGDTEWTYAELNRRANRIGRVLLARGLAREDVVAVVTERNLDWMASVLAIFKAGGAYLPIEPHFPGDRIATTLNRAGCKLILTERGSTSTLDQALNSLPGAQVVFLDAAYAEQHPDGDLGLAVTEDQLAYIYFTSGSTGEPKGAMCEQAGMLNHLYAKIDDLGVAPGTVVAQTAPQCFDISLWQLVSALLVGGRTLIVEQEVILDVARFVDRIAGGGVHVLQVVPSYLEVVLSYLEEHSRELPALRCVSVTGEALKKELTQRWFSMTSGIKLANAYGLTETSDDTNHEVMDRVPERERVPLGPAVNNVHVYVVDERLNPVPLGAPGEIVFSGVCVGRGYVNDPERTKAAFLADPHKPGERLYRSGDHGRWLPEGKLEFLGRRDSQVKIRGFRIEIGEIENKLLLVPGVRDGAVVVAERADHSKHLVAFYAGPQEIPVELLRTRLGESLPEYMVPTAFHHREALPLTANSKIDKKALTRLAGELAEVEGEYLAPSTPTEQRLAAAWSKVLGVPAEQIGRADHFFDRGGTSLSAVKLAIALERAVSLKDITRQPVLADLAALLDGIAREQGGLLQQLSESDGAAGTLVCFPYAGGNAVNFQPLAKALQGSGLGVYAVELPGHDLAAEREPFAPMSQVVDQVVGEITQRGLRDLVLWGHSSGTAFALHTARELERRGVTVRGVLLGAQLLGEAAQRRATVAELTARTDAEIAARLSSDSAYTELGELDSQRAEHVGAAYRHDCVTAHRYFAEAIDTPPAKLAAPVTAVLAADDPATEGFAERHADWRLFADRVALHELPEGGHYFLRTRPEAAADAVLRAAELLTSNRKAQ